MQVPLLGGLVPRPRGAAAEGRRPVVGRTVRRAVVPAVPVALGRVARRRGSRRTTGAGRRCGWAPSPAARGCRARARRRAARRRSRGRRRADRRRSSRRRRSRSRPSASGRSATARARRPRATAGGPAARAAPRGRRRRRPRRRRTSADRSGRRPTPATTCGGEGYGPATAMAARVPPMADVAQIGVVGAGFMGSGIAESAARAGVTVRLYEPQAAAARALALVDRGLGRARGQARAAHRRRGRGAARAHRVVDRPRRPGRVRARGRGDRRGRGGQGEDVQGPRRGGRPRGDPRVEHLVDPDRRPRGRHRAPRSRPGAALLLAGPRHEARRGRHRPRHRRRDRRAGGRLRRSRSARPRSRPRTARASSSTSCSCPT